MSKYKIHINPPPPAEEEMNRHKDFNRLLRQHQQRRRKRPSAHETIQKSARWVPVILLTILMLGILYIVIKVSKKKDDSSPKEKIESVEPSVGSRYKVLGSKYYCQASKYNTLYIIPAT